MGDRFSKVEVTLNADVANSGTFTVSYPSDKSQKSFNRGLAQANGYAIVDNNDKWNEADSKVSFSFGSSDITVTNSSGVTWKAGQKVSIYLGEKDGNDLVTLSFPVKLSKVSAADVITDIRPNIYGWIEDWSFLVTDPVTTGSKLATLNLEINTTDVTGGALALTSAAATPLGKEIAGAAITGANYITPKDTLSVEATSVTAFVEGEGVLMIKIRKDPAYA